MRRFFPSSASTERFRVCCAVPLALVVRVALGGVRARGVLAVPVVRVVLVAFPYMALVVPVAVRVPVVP
jgi:hypothetical protein